MQNFHNLTQQLLERGTSKPLSKQSDCPGEKTQEQFPPDMLPGMHTCNKAAANFD